MVEIRISRAQGAADHDIAHNEAEVFVFDDESDALLVRRWQRGDLAAASVAIQRHESMVYASTFRIVRNHAVSEDICQDAFLRAHENIASLRRPAAFGAWLRQIAVRLAIDELRRGALEQLPEDQPDGLPGPQAVVETMETLERFRAQINALPQTQRVVIVMRDIEGFSIRETAEQLGITEGAVKMRLMRARAALVQHFTPKPENDNE